MWLLAEEGTKDRTAPGVYLRQTTQRVCSVSPTATGIWTEKTEMIVPKT